MCDEVHIHGVQGGATIASGRLALEWNKQLFPRQSCCRACRPYAKCLRAQRTRLRSVRKEKCSLGGLCDQGQLGHGQERRGARDSEPDATMIYRR